MASYDPKQDDADAAAVRMAVVDLKRNVALGRRFEKFVKLPTVVLFRNKKMYEYAHKPVGETTEQSLQDMLAFARDGYKHAQEIQVPPPLNILDTVNDFYVAFRKWTTEQSQVLEKHLLKVTGDKRVTKELLAGILGGCIMLGAVTGKIFRAQRQRSMAATGKRRKTE